MSLILLTGASGFLGTTILKYLYLQQTKVLTVGRQSTNHIVCDLSLEIPLFNQAFDLVIHAAGKAHSIPKSNVEKNQFFDVNVKGVQNLLSGLELLGAPKQFVFISSIAVYGKQYGTNISERESLSAKDPYGLSKIQAEQIVIDWCKKNNVIFTILRLPLLVGKNPPGNLGVMFKAIQKGYYFNIGGGIAKKSMVLAKDVARFIPIISSIGGIYNLTDGEHPDFKQLSSAIAKMEVPNLPFKIANILGFLGDIIGDKSPINSSQIKKITTDLTFDDSKARGIGWNSQSVLEYLRNNDL
jgi:nucleoside-diphosphate-sugar epimerase